MPTPRKKENPLPLMERLLLSTEDAANLLDLSYFTMGEMIRDGVLPSVKIGTIIRVPRRALEKWIDEHTELKKNRSTEAQIRAAVERCGDELVKAIGAGKEN